MNIWDDWFDDETVAIYRQSSSTINNVTTETEAEIYEALPVVVIGRQSDMQHTILGNFALGEYQIVVRVSDIDENGWPEAGDRVVMNGKSYSVLNDEDHAKGPSIFNDLKHRVYNLTQDV